MTVCRDNSEKLLPEYVKGLLEPKEMNKVADHLAGCSECASQVRVISLFEDKVLPEPGPWFWTSLPGKVTARIEARRREKTRVLISVWAGGLVVAAVAVLMLLQPGAPTQPQTDALDYSVVEMADSFFLGVEEEILSVSGMFMDDLDQVFGLDLNDVSDETVATMDLILEGDGYETMDDETIRIFEDLLEEMTPKRVGKWVMS
ncbi:MAG: zf-HC2 domain-containing protein [bacterium]|nr:zf-HC2 domain-containing protein [bacterium]MDT8366646.1 zf-HC2 domain-containing protein [bacterium]